MELSSKNRSRGHSSRDSAAPVQYLEASAHPNWQHRGRPNRNVMKLLKNPHCREDFTVRERVDEI